MGIDKISADILSRTTHILKMGSDADLKRLALYLSKFKVEKPEAMSARLADPEEVAALIEKIQRSETSRDARRILDDSHASKLLLVEISKEIGLPIAKSDRLEHLKSKIVHELVEVRLNSKAIRNPNSSEHSGE